MSLPPSSTSSNPATNSSVSSQTGSTEPCSQEQATNILKFLARENTTPKRPSTECPPNSSAAVVHYIKPYLLPRQTQRTMSEIFPPTDFLDDSKNPPRTLFWHEKYAVVHGYSPTPKNPNPEPHLLTNHFIVTPPMEAEPWLIISALAACSLLSPQHMNDLRLTVEVFEDPVDPNRNGWVVFDQFNRIQFTVGLRLIAGRDFFEPAQPLQLLQPTQDAKPQQEVQQTLDFGSEFEENLSEYETRQDNQEKLSKAKRSLKRAISIAQDLTKNLSQTTTQDQPTNQSTSQPTNKIPDNVLVFQSRKNKKPTDGTKTH